MKIVYKIVWFLLTCLNSIKYCFAHTVKGINPLKTKIQSLHVSIKGESTLFFTGSSKCHSLKVKVRGNNNNIFFKGISSSSSIHIEGYNNYVNIEEESILNKTKIIVIGNNLKFILNSGASFGGDNEVVLMGDGKHVLIGKDCMIASNSEIWASDSHPIFKADNPKVIMNESGNVDIGNHVWIGRNVYILKNVKIGDNSVVGMASVVTKDIPSGSIAVGNPARVINTDVSWRRNHIEI